MADLFEQNARDYFRRHAPLARRLRPRNFDEFFGQEALAGPGSFLRRMVENDSLKSLILWGPPGTGKTTLARIVAGATGRRFVALSAVSSGVADLKKVLADASEALRLHQRGTILFLDEIHRYNKTQQDALLHGVEDGTLTLIGATTENPSFEVNAALLSRMQVLVLEPLDGRALGKILGRALEDADDGLGAMGLTLTPEAEDALIGLAAGDARAMLNFLELAALDAREAQEGAISEKTVRRASGRRAYFHDRSGEAHYNVVSALIKAMRGSDPDAAVYYLARMIEGGEAPEFVTRRLVIFASEDVGNADPRALQLAIACKDAVAFVGLPECLYALSQCVVYLAAAPKSNASGVAYQAAREAVGEHGALPVPLALRQAPTPLMKKLGYGRGYEYPHDRDGGWVEADYLPERLRGRTFYRPTDRGFERRIAEHLAALRRKAE